MAASFAIISLGCAKNLVDSEVMADRLINAGFSKVEPHEAAALIINTCAFIDPAKQEAIDTIFAATRARDEGEAPAEQKILVAGCLSQRYAHDLIKLMPEVDCFMNITETAPSLVMTGAKVSLLPMSIFLTNSISPVALSMNM